ALAHPIFQPETGRSIDPVPARGLQSPCTLLGALTPLVPFANVPGVNLHYQREGVLRQRQHLGRTLSATHLLIQLLTLFFCTLALPTSLPIQRSGWQLHPRQSFDHRAGLFDGHLADRQCCHFLHRRRGAASVAQTQGLIGWKAPSPAPPAPAAQSFDSHRPNSTLESPVVIPGATAQF